MPIFSANSRTSHTLIWRVIAKQNAARIVSLDSQRQKRELPVSRKFVFTLRFSPIDMGHAMFEPAR
jgi:hypothetical protein